MLGSSWGPSSSPYITARAIARNCQHWKDGVFCSPPGPSSPGAQCKEPEILAPAREPLTLKGMKGADSSVNARAARSLRSCLMTLEKKELDQHGGLTLVSGDCSPQRGCFPVPTSASHIMSCPLFQRCLVSGAQEAHMSWDPALLSLRPAPANLWAGPSALPLGPQSVCWVMGWGGQL